MAAHPGREELRVMDCAYIGFHELLEVSLERMTREQLDLIQDFADSTTSTNCGWSEYELVRTKAFTDAMLRARRRLAEVPA